MCVSPLYIYRENGRGREDRWNEETKTDIFDEKININIYIYNKE